jgi:hypothetical protein
MGFGVSVVVDGHFCECPRRGRAGERTRARERERAREGEGEGEERERAHAREREQRESERECARKRARERMREKYFAVKALATTRVHESTHTQLADANKVMTRAGTVNVVAEHFAAAALPANVPYLKRHMYVSRQIEALQHEVEPNCLVIVQRGGQLAESAGPAASATGQRATTSSAHRRVGHRARLVPAVQHRRWRRGCRATALEPQRVVAASEHTRVLAQRVRACRQVGWLAGRIRLPRPRLPQRCELPAPASGRSKAPPACTTGQRCRW